MTQMTWSVQRQSTNQQKRYEDKIEKKKDMRIKLIKKG